MMKKRALLRKIGIKLIALALILIGLLVLADAAFRPMIEKVNSYECHKAVSGIINKVVLEELERADTDYSSLVTLCTNDDGEVTSVQSNVKNINRLKTSVSDRVEREIADLSAVDIKIPIGTLLGIDLFHGMGFDVGMSVAPIGFANTTIISEFTEAGINQTLHRIIIEISADVDAIIPGLKTRVCVKTSIVAAETVIVGRVPNAYTHVITGSGDLAGTLNDYDAVLNQDK